MFKTHNEQIACSVRFLLLTALLVLSVLSFQSPSSAAVTRLVLKNNSSKDIAVVINYCTSSGKWITRGWWRIAPGKTAEPDVDTDSSYFYFYAEADDGETWNGDFDPDGITRWIVSDLFNHYDDSPSPPQGRNLRQASFFMSQASNNYLMQSFSD